MDDRGGQRSITLKEHVRREVQGLRVKGTKGQRDITKMNVKI